MLWLLLTLYLCVTYGYPIWDRGTHLGRRIQIWMTKITTFRRPYNYKITIAGQSKALTKISRGLLSSGWIHGFTLINIPAYVFCDIKNVLNLDRNSYQWDICSFWFVSQFVQCEKTKMRFLKLFSVAQEQFLQPF